MTANDDAKILIVDDEPAICDLLFRWLSREGHKCFVASSGEDALNLLRAEYIDLVLSDIMMPGMSGIDLLNIIRPLYPDVAVLMITAVNDKSTGLLALELGAYGYVVKPFDKNAILLHVAGALARHREKLSLQRQKGFIAGEIPAEDQRLRQVNVPLAEFLHCFRSGIDDAGLMEEFDLPSESLDELMRQLVSMGELGASELRDRVSLSAASVVIDSGEMRLPEVPAKKPVIDAADALRCITSGMPDSTLMKRYGISARGLQSLFGKLLDAGLIETSVIEGRIRTPELSGHQVKVPEGDPK